MFKISKGIGTGSRAWDAQFKLSISYLSLRGYDPAVELLYELDAAKTEYDVAISYSAELPAACSGARKGQEKTPNTVPSRHPHSSLNLVFTTLATPAVSHVAMAKRATSRKAQPFSRKR